MTASEIAFALAGFSGQDTLMPDGIANTTSSLPVRNFTLTFPINPKDDIDPGMPNTTTTRTTSTTTRSTVAMTTKTTTEAQTKVPPLPTTVKPMLETKETPFETTKTTSTTTKPTQLYNRSGKIPVDSLRTVQLKISVERHEQIGDLFRLSHQEGRQRIGVSAAYRFTHVRMISDNCNIANACKRKIALITYKSF